MGVPARNFIFLNLKAVELPAEPLAALPVFYRLPIERPLVLVLTQGDAKKTDSMVEGVVRLTAFLVSPHQFCLPDHVPLHRRFDGRLGWFFQIR